MAADRVEFVACGTANYATAVGATAFQDWPHIPARWNIGSEFRYSPPPLDERTLVVAVTQSGETADTIAPTRYARQQGCPSSRSPTPSARPSRARRRGALPAGGPEIAVVATKTFVTQVTTLVLLAAAMAKLRGRLPASDEATLVAACGRCRTRPSAPSTEPADMAARAPLRQLARLHVRRPRHGATRSRWRARSSSRKSSYVHAEGYAAGELKHGPISLLDAEVPLVAIATRSPVQEKLITNVMEGRARDARVLAVATEGDEPCLDFADDILWVPETIEELCPVLAIIPLQLFAYHTAVARGTDVDQPRNLAKSVTVE